MPVITAGTVVADGRVHRPGWLRIDAGLITGCGPGSVVADLDLGDVLVVPGFVDMHVHGGGGADYGDRAGIEIAAALHRVHGTTGGLASLVSAAPERLLAQVRALAEATRAGLIDGIHLEGPWLSTAHCGAHDRAVLRDPDRAEIDALLHAGDDAIRMVTLAPELPGAPAAIRHLVDAGVVVAVGHTDADYEATRAAIDAGATVGTHLFNAMRPLHHRAPGAVLALLDDERVTVELIADRVHLHPAVLRHVIAAAGPARVALVTDAMAAAGVGDGAFTLGGLDVEVSAGVARVRGTDTIAGSTATMDALFATAVALLGGADTDTDTALLAAAAMTATTPAHALGLQHAGALAPGLAADLVVLDRELHVARVMRRGHWVAGVC